MASSFFRSVTISADDATAWPDAIRRMRSGAFEGIIVKDVYSAPACALIRQRLEAGQHSLVRTGFPPRMRAFFLGINLNLANPDLDAYFREAVPFAEGLTRLFEGVPDLPSRVTDILSTLDEGRVYRAAPGPNGRADHMFTTLRAHMQGGFIPPHFDNEQAFRQSYRYLLPNIGSDLYSFVLAFSQAEAGGALEIFDMHHGGRAFRMADGASDASNLPLDGVDRVSFRLAPGEMILFNSGRYLHRVTPVEGASIRWTACSFMAEDRSGRDVYCWG